jgi:hypothetical protein
MWRLLAKRERNATTNLLLNRVNQHGRSNLLRSLSSASSPDVAVQLDYYMSLQFAGVACALVNGTFVDAMSCL